MSLFANKRFLSIKPSHYSCKALSVKKGASEKLTVTWTDMEKKEFSENFDTIMFAIARTVKTKELELEKAGVVTNGHKIDTVNEQTNVPHIYAVGDVLNVTFVDFFNLHFLNTENY